MASPNLMRAEGVVASVLDADWFSILLDDGQSLRARISRRFRDLQARLAVGDPVLVGRLPRANHDALILTGTRRARRVTV